VVKVINTYLPKEEKEPPKKEPRKKEPPRNHEKSLI
jgi:hypothetical protein